MRITALMVLSTIVGCEAKKKTAELVATSDSPSISAAALTLLEEADKLDGKSDHIISKCYVCSLGMDGSEKHTTKLGDYTAHLCSKSCQQEFEKSAEQIVLSTKIPSDAKQE
jgi:hypothetical protein